jgi:hypothetical protein
MAKVNYNGKEINGVLCCRNISVELLLIMIQPVQRTFLYVTGDDDSEREMT